MQRPDATTVSPQPSRGADSPKDQRSTPDSSRAPDGSVGTEGQHLLAEYFGCNLSLLGDLDQIEKILRQAAVEAGATVVGAVFHRFSPQGVSGVVLIAESHLSIHTWPECGYAAVDFFTCGVCDPRLAHAYMAQALEAKSHELMLIQRGQTKGSSIQVSSHEHNP